MKYRDWNDNDVKRQVMSLFHGNLFSVELFANAPQNPSYDDITCRAGAVSLMRILTHQE